MSKNILVGQSGGPTAVINGSLYGVITKGFEMPQIDHVYGMVNGIEGFLHGQMMDMQTLIKDGTLPLVKTTPGAYLGSCRYKLPEDLADPVYPELFTRFEEHEIEAVFYIGGNDSMDTVSKLSRYAAQHESPIRFIGIPKTIDNDLVMTDHTLLWKRAKYVSFIPSASIAVDASVYDNKPSVTIVEIMGRHAGWLTAASALARMFKGDNPVLIYLPETAFIRKPSLDRYEGHWRPPRILLYVSLKESTTIPEHSFASMQNDVGTDTFGHKMLTGSGKYLENLVKETLGIKVRSVELNVSQRCSSACLSRTDLQEAILAGSYGVERAMEGATGVMITFERKEGDSYEMTPGTADVTKICNEEKTVPADWITPDGSDVTEAFLNYARPLIQGQVEVPQKDGLPYFAFRNGK